MPSRDPKTGRPISGAEGRQRRDARAAEQARASAMNLEAAAADFDRLEQAPVGDSARAISWVNDAMLIAFEQVLRDGTLTNIERWQWMERLGKALGMLRDKAAEQDKIKRSLKDDSDQAKTQGTVSASGRTKKTISRPPG